MKRVYYEEVDVQVYLYLCRYTVNGRTHTMFVVAKDDSEAMRRLRDRVWPWNPYGMECEQYKPMGTETRKRKVSK